ncbi:MAG: adenine phosphoribosyltransferase [Nitrospinota bacterium]
MEDLKRMIRDIPDFPRKGVIFKDITTLLSNAKAFATAIDLIGDRYIDQKVDLVVGAEARGFVFGAALAYKLNAGAILIRKTGKLPYRTVKTLYELEYGTDELEIHEDAISEGNRVLLVDDLLATGGTASAAVDLIKKLKGDIVGLAFLIELTFLKGRERLTEFEVFSLIQF